MVLARRNRKVCDSFHAQLVPDGAQITRLVELHLVGDRAGAEGLVVGVLQVPASLRLLDKLPYHRPLGSGIVGHSPPDLQILRRIAVLVLGWTLPRYEVRPQRRKSELENIRGGERGDDVADGRIDDRNPGRMC